MKKVEGGITAVDGFTASGLHSGIKKKGQPDLALLYSQTPATAAGVFTTHRFQAAPLRVTREHLKTHCLQAVLINSGNANACTGEQGYQDAKALATWVAQLLKIKREWVAVASTGVIGLPLPMERILPKIPEAIRLLSRQGSQAAAEAIMTTDTVFKETAFQTKIGSRTITVGGIAKGSGMIHPKMATMLGFLSTDASLSPAVLKKALTLAVGASFNAISIDGCMSTNDMVLCLANGRAQNRPIPPSGTLFQHFKSLLETACLELAQMMVRDGEGATKFVEIRVKGAPSAQAAKRVATAVALSPLVKTALFGGDANWGRIMAAIGASGVKVLERQIDISFGEALLVKGGRVNPTTPEEPTTQYLKSKEIVITIHLHAGKEKSVVWTCDLSYDYVKINAAYRS